MRLVPQLLHGLLYAHAPQYIVFIVWLPLVMFCMFGRFRLRLLDRGAA